MKVIIYKCFEKIWILKKYYMNLNKIIKIPPAGLEPATFGSTVQRSAKLS